MQKIIQLLFLLLIISSCSSKSISIEGFDSEKWKSDPRSCENTREEYFEVLRSQKETLLSMNYDLVMELFGKPDERDLYQRGQWFYYYYFNPGPACNASLSRDEIPRMILRFSAQGDVTEVIFRK